jgi:hypothetical protein
MGNGRLCYIEQDIFERTKDEDILYYFQELLVWKVYFHYLEMVQVVCCIPNMRIL